MKSIGFVDYYLNEWHANNYVGWIRETSEKLGYDFDVKYAWAELDCDPKGEMSSDEWCNKYKVTKCASIDEISEKSDYIIILAPSNPETHLRYADSVLKYGKNTYIDKTFAPDFDTARKIFDIAEKYDTKFFSSSALRYASELDEAKGALSFATVGCGSNFEEYIIHQAEMLIKILGCDVSGVHSEARSDGIFAIDVKFDSGKSGAMLFDPKSSYAISAMLPSCTSVEKRIDSKLIFLSLIKDILRFFNDGTVSFNLNETLSVIKLRELAIKSVKNL